jgi:hypothetical protein
VTNRIQALLGVKYPVIQGWKRDPSIVDELAVATPA